MGLIRTAFSLVALLSLAYVLFLVPIGGASIASHVMDVWSSELVQKKVAEVRTDVATRLEQHLAEAQKNGAGRREAPTEADRKALTHLIEKLDPKAQLE